jgi:aminoglycoside phosphotransferase (APT) family kinase protein
MDTSEVRSAVNAAKSIASALGLRADDAVILHNSNRLTVRLLPCDVVARIAPNTFQASAEFELEIARRLAELGCPVTLLEPRVEPRVYQYDDFVINMWAYHEPVSGEEVAPAEYARALERLHAGMRNVDLPTPHFTDRVAEAQAIVSNAALSPGLRDADRELLGSTLRELTSAILQRGDAEQLLHGEPHPGNVLNTNKGPLFIDFETCCRGPVEFDLAHAPEAVAEQYAGANQNLIRDCRILMLAMVAAWRWDRNDQFPNGLQMGTEFVSRIRAARSATSSS